MFKNVFFGKNSNCKKMRRSRVGRFQLFSSEMEDQKKTLKPARFIFQSCNNTSTLDEISHLRDNNSVGVIALKQCSKVPIVAKALCLTGFKLAQFKKGYAFFEVVSQYSSRCFSEELV